MLSAQKPLTASTPASSVGCRGWKRLGYAATSPCSVALVEPKLQMPGRGLLCRKMQSNRDRSRRDTLPAPSAAAAAAAPVAAAAAAPGARLLVALATIYAAPFFGMMVFAPKWKKTRQIMDSYALFVPLALAYAYLLAKSWQPDTISLMIPGSLKEGLNGFNPQFFPKLEGVAVLFSRLTTAASVWVHIITINLFFAKVCYTTGLAAKIPTAHTVILAACFGPLGILSTVATQMAVGTVGCFAKNKPLAQRKKMKLEAEAATQKASPVVNTEAKPLGVSTSKTTSDISTTGGSGNRMPTNPQEPTPGSELTKATPLESAGPSAPKVSKPSVSSAVEVKEQMGTSEQKGVSSKVTSAMPETIKKISAVEVKKSAVSAIEQGSKLEAAASKQAAEVSKPVAKASKPDTEATKPPVQVSKPAAEVAKPIVDVPKPVVPKPTTEAPKPQAEPIKPASESPKVESKSESKAEKPSKPSKSLFSRPSKPDPKTKNTIEGSQPPGTVVLKNGDGFIILLPYST